MIDILYAQSRATSFKHVWTKVPAYHAKTTFKFTNYIFKINGVIYKSATPEWEKEIARLKVWETLRK